VKAFLVKLKNGYLLDAVVCAVDEDDAKLLVAAADPGYAVADLRRARRSAEDHADERQSSRTPKALAPGEGQRWQDSGRSPRGSACPPGQSPGQSDGQSSG
jgi:hypothetical protein